MQYLRIGVTGSICSGKSSVVEILKEEKYRDYSLSKEVIAEFESRKLGRTITRKDKQDIGDEMRQKLGDDYWAVRTGRIITRDLWEKGPANIVIDAIFNPAEEAYLEKVFGAVIIGVDANPEIRLQRLIKRARDSEQGLDEAQLRTAIERDLGIGQPLHGQQTRACLERAYRVIRNDTGDMRDLRANLTAARLGLGIEGVRRNPRENR